MLFDAVVMSQINLTPNSTARKGLAQDALNGWDPSYEVQFIILIRLLLLISGSGQDL